MDDDSTMTDGRYFSFSTKELRTGLPPVETDHPPAPSEGVTPRYRGRAVHGRSSRTGRPSLRRSVVTERGSGGRRFRQ
ncbi:hypothetical protein SUGI_1228100 [Cryptomeria japonica]|uniref:Uncharacterized protein n=1 Tax=Cryptomeria japonica TaxID=3369 RepID=A0AAD3NRY8_CRYJA|nr:hypothetical protein SUGI_1228100 [Cryptomeria japonica]